MPLKKEIKQKSIQLWVNSTRDCFFFSLVNKPVYEKENFQFNHAVLHLKIVIVSHLAHSGIVWTIYTLEKNFKKEILMKTEDKTDFFNGTSTHLGLF